MSRSAHVTIEREELDLILAAARAWLDDTDSGLAEGYYDETPADLERVRDAIELWSA
jgi:hypothetical protein